MKEKSGRSASDTFDEWVERYKQERPRYEILTTKVKALLEELLGREGIKAIVESRTKDAESFRLKLSRPAKFYAKPLEEVTDLSGIRVILHSLRDVDEACSLIKREFMVDTTRSVDKLELLDPSQFGYLSRHFVVKVGARRKSLPEWAGISDLWAEIQVRTVLQHAWATVSYFLDYKATIDAPEKLRRRLFRLNALFELADDELNAIVGEANQLSEQYKQSIELLGAKARQPRQVKKRESRFDLELAIPSFGSGVELGIELNVNSLRIYLEKSKTMEHWAKFIESIGVGVGPADLVHQDVEMARRAGIETIDELDSLLRDSMKWGEGYLKEYYDDLLGYVERELRTPIRRSQTQKDYYAFINGIVRLLLIANFPDIFTAEADEVLEYQLGIDPRSVISLAKKHNPRYKK